MKKPALSLDKLAPFFDKIAKLSKVQRLLICVGALILLIGPMVYFSFLPKIQKIGELKTQHEDLEKKLSVAKQKASQLKKYERMLEAAKADFATATSKLPQAKEIPNLLASISGSGQEAGLEFLLFQPEEIVLKDFYAEIPVAISVTGTYFKAAQFFDKIAHLSRIVNIRDIKMVPLKEPGGLSTSCKAVTYMFIEKDQGKKGS